MISTLSKFDFRFRYMVGVKKHVRANRRNSEKNSLRAKNETLINEGGIIQSTISQLQEFIQSIILVITMLRKDIVNVSRRIATVSLESAMKDEKLRKLEYTISQRRKTIVRIQNEKKNFKKMNRKNRKIIKNQENELNNGKEEVFKLQERDPSFGCNAEYRPNSHTKIKKDRCERVILAIRNLVGSENVDNFLHYFLQFVNDSRFKTRFQLSPEETFFAKVRFHLTDGFLKKFHTFYHTLTGFNVFSSRWCIGHIQKKVSCISDYTISIQDVVKKMILGPTTTVKRPKVLINNISVVLARRLSNLAASGRLVFDSSTGNNICVTLGGDKGGEEAKLLLIIENVSTPNDANGIMLLGYYTGNDDYKSLKENFGEVFEQFNKLTEVQYECGGVQITKNVQKRVAGDCKFLSSLYGHGGQSSSEPCHLCFTSYSTHGSKKALIESFEFDKCVGRRSLSDYRDSLVDVPLENSAIPPMHIFQGLTQKYGIDHFLSECNRLDYINLQGLDEDDEADVDFPDSLAAQKKMLKNLENEENHYLKRISAGLTSRESYYEILEGYEKVEKRKRRKEKYKRCESTACLANVLNKKLAEDDTIFRCETCQKTLHYYCNGVVELDENEMDGAKECFECTNGGRPSSIHSRKTVVKEKLNKLEDVIEDDEKSWDAVTKEKDNVTVIIKDATGPMRKKFDKIMRKIGCENYHCSQNITGNMSRKFLRKAIIDEIISIFKPSEQMESLRMFLYDLSNLMSTSNNSIKTNEEIEEIRDLLSSMISNLKKAHPKKGIILKLHLLCAHLMPYLEKHRSWGKVSEQGIEMIHQVFKKLQLLYAPVRDLVRNASLLVQSHANNNMVYDVGEWWNE
ncbi:hypothetical protein CRE_16177 [Caenorhabditis remanei]|uniref:Zinc finger PHD-type domain-containing protein n=2 Tax=Caenorhabditis remanei TaxID=31234 RepID=E3MSQ5_CAERE|nr:hypothetical protein CRE_16177 [Caenorhabditis remanei]